MGEKHVYVIFDINLGIDELKIYLICPTAVSLYRDSSRSPPVSVGILN